MAPFFFSSFTALDFLLEMLDFEEHVSGSGLLLPTAILYRISGLSLKKPVDGCKEVTLGSLRLDLVTLEFSPASCI